MDAWDEALRDGSSGGSGRAGDRSSGGEKRRTRAEISEGQQQAEAGKVWERGRNWVTIVVEAVPVSLKLDNTLDGRSGKTMQDTSKSSLEPGTRPEPPETLKEDEDILEIPVFVRLEWEESVAHDEASEAGLGNRDKEKRELAYWCVLGVGRISEDF